jgi:hypothetical protein
MSSRGNPRAIFAAPTLEDFWMTCAVVRAPDGCASWIVKRAIVSAPGAVWITVCGVIRPISIASATVNGLSVEPGSNRSVMTRLRSCAPLSLLRLLGL